MKKLFSITLLALLVFASGTMFAQCNINNSNTTSGFTPDPPTVITQGASYAQTVQVYVPTSYSQATIDSVHIDSIGNLPSGITYVFNPHDGDGGTVNGGANGAICFSGVTHDTVGTYTCVFHGTAYVKIGGAPTTFQLNAAPLDTVFTYAFTVQAAQATSGCDTTFNVSLNPAVDTPSIYIWSPGVGYISGNGGFTYGGQTFTTTQVAEQFFGATGDSVTNATLEFGYTAIKSTDSALLVKVYLYNNTGTGLNSTPGTPFDSANISLRAIAHFLTAHLPAQVPFTGAVLTSSTFYVSVVLPTTTGDTVVLVTNSGSTANGKGYLLIPATTAFGGNGWLPYTGIIGGINQLGNYIGVTVCGSNSIAVASFTENSTSGCGSLTVNFTDQSSGTPTAYSWDFGDQSAVSTTASPSHTYAAGSYTATETVTSTGGTTFAYTFIFVDSLPVAVAHETPASSSSAHNGQASVTVTSGNAPYSYTYLWSNGATTDTIRNIASGYYSVTITDANGCTVSVDSIDVLNTGIINLSSGQKVTVYPNPATNALNLVWSEQSNAEVSVVDLNGKVISTITTSGETKTLYDIHDLATGSYILRITDKTNNQQQSMLFSKF